MFKPVFSLAKKLMSTFKPKPQVKRARIDMPKPKKKEGFIQKWITRDVMHRLSRVYSREKTLLLNEARPSSPIQPLRRIRPLRAFYSTNRFRRVSGLKEIRFRDGIQTGG